MFRTININGLVINNVLFLELIVKRLRELTYPEDTHPTPVPSKSGRGQAEKSDITPVEVENEDFEESKGGAVPFQRERVSLLKEGGPSAEKESCNVLWETGGDFSGATNTKNTTKTIPLDFSNPIQSYHRIGQSFMKQIDYDAIWNDRPFDREWLEEITAIAVDVLASTAKTIRINREDKPSAVVKSVVLCQEKVQIKWNKFFVYQLAVF